MTATATRLQQALESLAPIQSLVIDTEARTVVFSSAEATTEQEAALRAVVDNFDWSDEAHTTWQTTNDRAKAIAALFGDAGHVPVGVRATFRVLWTTLNDVRESLGQPRLNEKEIAGMIVAAIQAGEGDPVAEEKRVRE